MKLVIPFEEASTALVSQVGGKGTNLIALTSAGFPVPPGFVVTTEAYSQFIHRAKWLDAQVAAFDYEHPDQLNQQCEQLRSRLRQLELPDALQHAVQTCLASQASGQGTDAAFAVRSSSSFEDLAQAAFAGQHDTYLNVRGIASVLRRIRDCFVSLWADRAVSYRHHHGFSQRDAAMAVVVQQQIDCEVAGVGFSINPVSGRMDRMLINANYGLGESVVSGECEVDQFELEKSANQITQRSVGHKTQMVATTAEGAEHRTVSPDLSDRCCMDDGQIRAVGELIKRVEQYYGWPQDIEWGLSGGSLFLLQSRPVTTLQPHWTRDESAERFPMPMTPLCWDFISVAFRCSLTHSLGLMGLPPLRGDWFERFQNFIYGNQNMVQLVASYRPLRARNAQELVAEIPDLRRRYAWVLDLPVLWARDLDRYLIRLGRLSVVSLDDASVQQIWQHVTEALQVAGEYFLPNIAISMTQSFLHRMLHGLVGMLVGPDRTLAVVDGLLAGCETKTAVVNREIHELARLARDTPGLAQKLAERDGRDVWGEAGLDAYPDFAARFARFLEDHGHREIDVDYYHPTWSGQPWVVLDSVALLLRNDQNDDPAETARQLRQRYFQTEHQFLQSVPEPVRFFFRELIRLTRTYTTLDDLEHYQTTRINPIAHRAARALGLHLRDAGILDAPEDVFFFQKSDLERLVAEYPAVQSDSYRTKVYEAKRSYEQSLRESPPWSQEETAAVEAPSARAGIFPGLPGSPGRVTGPCFLVHSPADFGKFPKNSILVARTTNPAWTALFYSAAGLITESGGPLSHGAVTAREMQLPAVMSVRGAMSIFTNGQIVTVDGGQGIVQTTND